MRAVAVALLVSCGGRVDASDALPSFSGGETRWYRVERVAFHIDLDGTWRSLGFNLDGLTTSAADSVTSANSPCKRREGSSTKVLEDGIGGIDNNFVHQVGPIMKPLELDLDALATSLATLHLRLDNVGPPNNASVPGSLFVGTSDSIFDRELHLRGSMRDSNWTGRQEDATVLVWPFSVPTATAQFELHNVHMQVRGETATLGAELGPMFVRTLPRRPSALWGCREEYLSQIETMFAQSFDLGDDPTQSCTRLSMGVELTLRAESPIEKRVAPPIVPPVGCTTP